ncbi:hypothetical protein MXD81_23710, partial [Microbacteriaceae bacterium K1510]|nr:hypothetical protein [Microbacteriaceae bacterium K1510]
VYMMMNGKTAQGGIYQYSMGIKRFHYAEGTWRDAEDGVLAGNPIAQGSVDSTVSFRMLIGPHEEQTLHYWVCIGDSYDAVKTANQYVLENDPDHLLNRVGVYWQRWVNKEPLDFADLPPKLISLYKKS